MRELKLALVWKILVVLFLALPAVPLFAFGGAVGAVVGGVCLALFIFFWLLISRARIVVAEDRIERSGLFGKKTIPYAALDRYNFTVMTVNGVDQQVFNVYGQDKTKLGIGAGYPGHEEAIAFCVENIHKHIDLPARFSRGETVTLGPVSLSTDELSTEKVSVPLGEVVRVEITANNLVVHGRKKKAFSVSAIKVPFVFALLDELRARKIEVGDPRPGKWMVSSLGFAKPKF